MAGESRPRDPAGGARGQARGASAGTAPPPDGTTGPANARASTGSAPASASKPRPESTHNPASHAGVADLTEQTVLVTGGAKRIGAAIVRDLAAAGCHVVIHYAFSEDEAEALAASLRDAGREASTVQADLMDVEAAQCLVTAAAEAAGRPIDLLVNNASSFPKVRWSEATYDDVDRMMRIHAWAPFVATRILADGGGRAVVNLLDTRMVADDPLHAPYLLSKQALWHLTKEMARRFSPLRVNAVAPGPILPPTGGKAADLEAARKATVLGRIGSPEGIAHAVRFLFQNEYVTGETVFVDGGRHLQN